ncbi:MAG: alpha/beta fold hydrolase [Pseudomonadota bacterium]
MAQGPHRRAGLTRRALVLGAPALAAGCGVGGPAGPDTADPRLAPEGPAAAAGRAPGWPAPEGPVPEPVALPVSGGAGVPATRWLPDGPRAAVLALHGFGDHGRSTYDAAARAWGALGLATHAPDQRGFGRGPTRGRWPGADVLVADARAAMVEIRRRHPDLPLVLVGHSMGGGIALAAAAPGGDVPPPDALVLAAPAIWGGTALNPLQRLAAWGAAAVFPDRRFTGEGVVRIQASDNIEALRALGRDPYYLGAPSARELFGLVRVVDRAAEAAPEVTAPSLLLLGERDQILPLGRVREIHARLPGPREVLVYPDGWHLLFRDVQAPRVWDDVATFALAPGRAG